MNIALLSSNYNVRRLNIADVQDIYSLCIRNESYYRYCPPFVTKHSILNDTLDLQRQTDTEIEMINLQ